MAACVAVNEILVGLGVMVALWYFVIGLPFAWLARRVEARLGRHLQVRA